MLLIHSPINPTLIDKYFAIAVRRHRNQDHSRPQIYWGC